MKKKTLLSNIPEDVQEHKAFKKALKTMGEDMVREFYAKTEEDLKNSIAVNTMEIQKAKDETAQNQKFVDAKEVIKLFNNALKETVSAPAAANNLATLILNYRKSHK